MNKVNSNSDYWLGKYYNTRPHIPFSRREVTEKPTVVANYDQFMLGVDKLDQQMAYYNFLHKSVKWWRNIVRLLEVMVINAYVIYKKLARRREIHHSPSFSEEAESEPIRSSTSPSARPGPRASQHLECLQPVHRYPQKRRDVTVWFAVIERTALGI